MSKLALIWRNDAEDATFTATNDTGFPESNLATTRLDKTYRRTATVSALTVDADFGASSPWIGLTDYGIVWGATDLGDGATWSIITDDNSGFSSSTSLRSSADMFDVSLANSAGWAPANGRHGIHLGTTATERYVRLSFTESGGTVLDGAFLFAGPVWQPGKSYEIGWEQVDELGAGGKLVRGIEMRFGWLTPAETSDVLGILRTIGLERRVFLVPQTDRDETWISEAMLCTMKEAPTVTHHDGTANRYKSIRLVWREVEY